MNGNPELSICIPTYNRLEELRGCLDLLIPQVVSLPAGCVNIVIVDNASTDGTAEFTGSLPGLYGFIKVLRNDANLGFDGNTVRCIQVADGDYTALLSDDDRYIDGQVAAILQVISRGTFALIDLNHYSYWSDVNRPYQTCAPEEDIVFTRALDILHYPAFGHFSGIIYNSSLAKETLSCMLTRNPVVPRDRSRGVYMEVALRMMATSNLPAYFVGARRLAVSIPTSVDYSLLEGLLLGSLHNTLALLEDGIISQEDWQRGISKGISQMPRYIILDAPKMSKERLRAVSAELVMHFGSNKRFWLTCFPLLWAGRFRAGKLAYTLFYRSAKPVVTLLNNVRTSLYARQMARAGRQ